MLTTASVTTMLPVVDLNRAKKFYAEQLGLIPKGASSDGKFLFSCGNDTVIALFPKAGGTQADHTAISFEVENLETEIRELSEKGVIFEDYDLPGLKTIDHVCVLGAEKAAWFKDPDGNILCVHEVI